MASENDEHSDFVEQHSREVMETEEEEEAYIDGASRSTWIA